MRHEVRVVRPAIGAALLAGLLVVACSGNEAGPEAATAAEPPRDAARTLPIPGADGLPPGHPEVESGAGTGLPVTWTVPEGWQPEQPDNSVRLAQYRVPGSGGDGECVVFYFGPGQGGDPLANAQRWAGQFIQPDGSDSLSKMKVDEVNGGRLPLMLVEVTGTYDGGMSGDPATEDAMLLGGIAAGPDAPWFFKLIGPAATVREQRDAFVELLRSVVAEAPEA